MVGSRATRSATAREAALVASIVASTTVNQPKANHLPDEVNLDVDIPPRPYIVFPPPRAGTI